MALSSGLRKNSCIAPASVWLAFFAIAMLFIAPLISTAVSNTTFHRQVSYNLSIPGNNVLSVHEHHLPSRLQPHHTPSGFACDYCVLLAYSPFVQLPLVFFLFFRLIGSGIPSDTPHIPASHFSFPYRARGPPFFSGVTRSTNH